MTNVHEQTRRTNKARHLAHHLELMTRDVDDAYSMACLLSAGGWADVAELAEVTEPSEATTDEATSYLRALRNVRARS
jgi:hypothetical protein